MKFKPKKVLSKKIKITARGKILRSHQLRRGHLRRHKSKEALRRYKRTILIDRTMEKTVKQLLGK